MSNNFIDPYYMINGDLKEINKNNEKLKRREKKGMSSMSFKAS